MTTRHHSFDALHNFRDLGGCAAAGGRSVRWGLLYRSDSLGKLDSPRTSTGCTPSACGP